MNTKQLNAETLALRDEIAIRVLTSLISINERYGSDEAMASDCYDIAEAMLAEREKRGVV